MVLIALKHSVCIDNWETIFLKKILSALKSDKWAALILQKVQLNLIFNYGKYVENR